MAALIPPVFPLKPLTYPGFSVHRRPTFATIPQESTQGRFTSSAQQQVPLWEFELTYEFLRDKTQNIIPPSDIHLQNKAELTKLLELFLCCASQYGEFLFLDSTDNSRFNQFIASGDGVEVTFPFIRLIVGDVGVVFSEQVGAINNNFSVTIYVDGVEITPGPSTWGLSEDLTSVVFITPPGLNALITSTFHYYYRCRWISDYQEVEEFVNLYWTAKSVRFRSLSNPPVYSPPEPLPPIVPPNPPEPASTLCLKDFLWWNRTPSIARVRFPNGPDQIFPGGNKVDKHGNHYVYEGVSNLSLSNSNLDIFSPSGTVVASHTQQDLISAVNAWYGSSIVGTPLNTVADVGFPVKVIKQGNYLAAYLGPVRSQVNVGHLARWFVVLDPQADGSLSIVGACYHSSLTGPPYGNYFDILDVANGQNTSDPILYMGSMQLGGFSVGVGALPSIDEIATPVGYYPGYPCRIPVTILYPIGNADLSNHLLSGTGHNHSHWSGFILPSAGGGTILYIYFNRGYMDFCLANSILMANKEVKTVIQPVYPHGAMIKVNLGVLDFAVLAGDVNPTFPSFAGTDTAMYSIDNANWKTGSGFTAIPFPDEYTYISLGNSPGGTDVYEMSPGAVVKRPSGKWWIFLYMSGVDDSIVNGGNQVLTSFRLFEWDPATEVATQLVYDSCLLHTYNNINMPAAGPLNYIQQDFYLTFEFVDEDDGSVTIIADGLVFRDRFYNFTP